MQCPICHITGSAQLFLNKKGEVRYARVRHYKGLNESKKPQFSYCKLEDLNKLETLLTSLSFHFPQAQSKQLGRKTSKEFHDQISVSLLSGQPDSSLKFEMAGPVGFEPTTFSLEG
jgi:hypothetical protein